MHCTDISTHNRTHDLHHDLTYKILREQHWFKYYRYRNLWNMQNVIPGYQIIDFVQVLLSKSLRKTILSVNRCTCWATHWQTAQFSWVGRYLLNSTQIDCLGRLATQTTNSVAVCFQQRPGPDATVQNRWSNYPELNSPPPVFLCLSPSWIPVQLPLFL